MLQHVAHMEHAGDVGRRDHQAETRASRVVGRTVELLRHPGPRPVWLDSVRGINLGNLFVQLRPLLTRPAELLKSNYYNGSAGVSQTLRPDQVRDSGFRSQESESDAGYLAIAFGSWTGPYLGPPKCRVSCITHVFSITFPL